MEEFNLAGYLIFALATAITPGPNNYLLFSYGKKYGFKDSSKLMSGIMLGFLTLLYASGYGIAEIITRIPTVRLVLKIISSIWLLYLAFLISRLNSDISEDSNTKIGFYKGFFMQFVNPKAWIMAIAGASAFLPHFDNVHASVFVFAITFGIVGIPCMISWVFFGDVISGLLKSENSNRVLGYILFSLMSLSVIMIWI